MKHLKSVNENYFKHMFEAISISLIFILAGFVCLVHAFFPFIFKSTASSMVKYKLSSIEKRVNKNE